MGDGKEARPIIVTAMGRLYPPVERSANGPSRGHGLNPSAFPLSPVAQIFCLQLRGWCGYTNRGSDAIEYGRSGIVGDACRWRCIVGGDGNRSRSGTSTRTGYGYGISAGSVESVGSGSGSCPATPRIVASACGGYTNGSSDAVEYRRSGIVGNTCRWRYTVGGDGFVCGGK